MNQDLNITAPCWNCQQTNPTHLLEGVRLMRCPNPKCKAELPGVSNVSYQSERLKEKLPLRIRGTVATPGYE